MPVPTPATMPATTSRPILPSPHASAGSRPAERRANPGDRMTVDPDDRRRRARTALLELAVARSVERRRVI
ncbi:hypothetical protein [Krasilnikoviella flava]|uniref:Uncharacterized protein n=1 Tax=Krasilnikoviella flava TaxID=526729 RepID=A0A1T5K1G4_9MICO|nr:hypothetical protein [Krasilnikoviella flava]SKC57622.1 hypothetical protein SAMN04324258_1760 [Krasilnikoviella flava]